MSSSSAPPSPGFTAGERFHVLETLGSGAFGTVYKAHDVETNEVVALKRLHLKDPRALVRFKEEFRSLADVSHPNLASLYELHARDDEWFFTMEYVDGPPFHGWLTRPGGPRIRADTARWETTAAFRAASVVVDPEIARDAEPGSRSLESLATDRTVAAGDPALVATIAAAPGDLPVHGAASGSTSCGARTNGRLDPRTRRRYEATLPMPHGRGGPCRRDEERLRESFRQLASAIAWLHACGKLHRDIKANNVLVDRDGRVVVLDFGLVTRLEPGGDAAARAVAGTPGYMAPEVCVDGRATEACDWYSFGVMLYQALTGESPFSGDVSSVLEAKRALPALPPREVAGDVPEDLDELCVRLLDRDPERRPDGDAILRTLGEDPGSREHRGAVAIPAADHPFVGRNDELATLRAGLDAARDMRQAAVLVSGLSGIGKTSLVEHFLGTLEPRDDLLVLRSRCYHRGSVPYRALDGVVDGLARHLATLPELEAAGLRPPGLRELARLFPVLDTGQDDLAPADSVDVREALRRAFRALRGLLTAVGRTRTLILALDDLQWGDEDSLAMLAEVLRPPNAPPLLLVGTYRSDEVGRSPFLRGLLGPDGPFAGLDHVARVNLGHLDDEAARDLALRLVADPARAERLARESGGNPLFIDELARRGVGEADGETSADRRVAVDAMILERVRTLPDDARRFLEFTAIAGEPVPDAVVRRAAGLEGLDLRMLNVLQHGRLLRSRPARREPVLEPYHDRIRETVVRALDGGGLRGRHLRLAEAALELGREDPEFLATHLHLGGDDARASVWARAAAHRAASALAFDRAVEFFRLALDTATSPDRDLRLALADALRNAGRGPEAARTYLEAAEEERGAAARALRTRAAEQFLFSGAFDEGEAAIRRVLGSVGVGVTRNMFSALAAFGLNTLRVRRRGLSHRERSEEELSTGERERIDVLWSGTIGLSMANPVAAQAIQQRHLLRALDAGEPMRVSRALSVELAFSGITGGTDERRSRDLSRRARGAAQRVQAPYAVALTEMSDGAVHWLRGRWQETLDRAEEALDTFRADCTGVTWEVDTARFMALSGLLHMGRLRELRERLGELLADSVDRGDLYMEMQLRTRFVPMIHLMDDQPEAATGELARAIARWTAHGYHIVHLWEFMGQVQARLYEGRGADALAWLDSREGPLKRSMILLNGQYYRAQYVDLRARADLVHALESPRSARRSTRRAERRAGKLEGEAMAWIAPHAHLLRACAATLRDDAGTAERHLEDAADGFERVRMALHARVSRRRLAQLRRDTPGIAEADTWMREETIARPERVADLLAPGDWPR